MKKIFVLISVFYGIIQEPEIFYKAEDAELRKEKIKGELFNPDYDDLDIFEIVA